MMMVWFQAPLMCTFITLTTSSWMVPLALPSWDMERRSVSMAWWLELPTSDSPFTATSWSLMHKRPSFGSHQTWTHTHHNPEYSARLHPALASPCRLDLAPGDVGASTKASVTLTNQLSVFILAHLGVSQNHLVRSPSVDDGFDEDPQVLARLPGLVSFEADAQTRRAAVIKRHLKRELLLSGFGNKDRQAGQLVLLWAGETVMGVEVEKEMLMRKRASRTQLAEPEWPPEAKQKSFSIWEDPSGESFHLNLSQEKNCWQSICERGRLEDKKNLFGPSAFT